LAEDLALYSERELFMTGPRFTGWPKVKSAFAPDAAQVATTAHARLRNFLVVFIVVYLQFMGVLGRQFPPGKPGLS
jgi:hypothetical protein